jgi:hypothetical protein
MKHALSSFLHALARVAASRPLWSAVFVVAGMVSLVAFGATFGLRWAFLTAVPCLLILGVALGTRDDRVKS